MNEFKVGDVVHHVDTPRYKLTIKRVSSSNKIEFEEYPHSGYFESTNYRLVKPKTNPLIETVTRTVTRTIEEEVTEQRLKSGTYGQIYIAGDENVYHCNTHSGKMNHITKDKLDETIDALIAIRDHWRAVGKIK